MPRYKIIIEYDGTPFIGWQKQIHGSSIQAIVEQAASTINNQPTQVYAAGRTDSGVHALGQAAHVDMCKAMRTDKLRDALNFHMGATPVAVLDAQPVADDFHARFNATGRVYLYRLIERRARLTLSRNRVWRIPQKLDAEAMHKAAQIFIGTHDFSSFRDSQCQAQSPVKSMNDISIKRVGAEVHATFYARSFLHKQVRSLTGSLVEVGRGAWTKAQIQTALDTRHRQACGPVAPAHGLYLVKVQYDIDS